MSNDIALQIAIPAGTAVLGFVSSYALERIKERRDPSRRISWEAATEQGIVETHPDLRGNIAVSYQGTQVDNLTAVTCRISNTGNRVVKNQIVRFEFPADTRILDASLDPVPQREIGVARNSDREEGGNEVVYIIGHLEKAQEITVKLLATGRSSQDWNVYSFNEEGDVEFQRRDVSRQRADREHVVPFLAYMMSVVLVAIVLFPAASTVLFSYVVLFVEAVLVILIAPHFLPFFRWVRDSLSSGGSDVSNSYTGRGNALFVQGNVFGGVRIRPEVDVDNDDD